MKKVVVEIDNKEIGGSDTFIIGEAMAKGGTSYTVAVVLNVKKDAPNGETPVYVKLFMGENLIDSKTLTLRVKIKEPSTNLIVAEKDSDMGYIKSKSSAYNSMSMTVADPGEYMVEVQVFEGGKLLAQNYAPVTVKQKPGPGQPSDIKLMDMNLVVTKIYSDGSGALVDVSPGIYNQGGDSGALAIEVTARVDQYTQYTRSDDIGIVKGSESRRGKVTFDIPRNREYSFIVSIIEGGKTVMSAKVNAKIKLMEVKYNTLMTYSLVEEGKPVAAAATQKEPGFEAIFAIAGLLAVAFLVLRQRK
ncbi:MAG: PGF-CTERM sorting domain-containing protein [Candidatus Methanoperedens sp.]|nr:PGF-CTERM sorting domain-containing protein [Candidatus Methanoperedens sp.]